MENSMKISPRYAGFWIRFLAFFLDGIILIIPSFLLDFLLYTLNLVLAFIKCFLG
jgi:uncharacterized RDD family membrane protein YckC